MSARFQVRLDRILSARDSLVCVGLDPDSGLLPKSLRRRPRKPALRSFLKGIIRATTPFAAAYKMQFASYLAFGPEGMEVLAELPPQIGRKHLTILDLKANDIPNIMRHLRTGAFESFGFDAITASPWMGWESLEPLWEDSSHGTFVVAHSSNPGSVDFQEIPTPRGPLWLAVVGEVRRLAMAHGNAGVVVGATYPDLLRQTRAALGNGIPILVPGVGAQGGQLATTVRDGVDAHGRGLLVSSSRSILYASDESDWAKAAGIETERLRDQINQLRSGLRTPR